MRGAGEETYELALVEGRTNDSDVVQMARPLPGVVGDVDVALEDVFAPDAADEMADGFGHGVDVAGGARHRLREHAAADIVDAGGEIAGLAHAGRKGCAHERLRLFLDHGDQPVPHHLMRDRGG